MVWRSSKESSEKGLGLDMTLNVTLNTTLNVILGLDKFEFFPLIRAQQQPLLSPPSGSFLNHDSQEYMIPLYILLTFLLIPPCPPSHGSIRMSSHLSTKATDIWRAKPSSCPAGHPPAWCPESCPALSKCTLAGLWGQDHHRPQDILFLFVLREREREPM